jgi:HEAT repeat protein
VRLRQLSVLLAELQAISPLPSDEELVALPEAGSRRVDKYVELLEAIWQETKAEFPPEVVSVLLSSFGVGDGYEVYWTTVHLIECFPDEHILYTFIQQATTSPNPGTRKWGCLLLGRRRSLDDLPFLLERLKDEVPAVRTAALLYGIALLAQVYALPQAIPIVAELLSDEQESVREHAREVMATLRG